MTSDRTRELGDHVIRTVLAVADRDADRLPDSDALGELTMSEVWGMNCAVLEMIKHLGRLGRDESNPDDFWMLEIEVDDRRPEGERAPTRDDHLPQTMRVVTAYANGDMGHALALWTAGGPEVAAQINAGLLELAAMLVRQREEERRAAS